ncbi:MAG: alpha-D-ribose 1-methylphosphonate 5-triphosphate diphosphatase [Hyphomicrobiaceae bacterium]
MITRIINGTALLPDGTEARIDVGFAGGVISAVGASASGTAIDARDLLVLPGIVDVHGDAFERSLMPRPGITFDHAIALAEADRTMVAHGITTGYLGLTVSWEPGLRSLAAGQETVAALAAARPHLATDLRLQIRWETFALHAVDAVVSWLDDPVPPVVAFNDHTTKTLDNRTDPVKLQKWADRSGLTAAAYQALVEEVAAGRADVPAAVARIAGEARRRGIVILSHDDETREQRAYYRDLGATVCEFPLTMDAIEDARSHGEPTVLGAPNILRGGSHTGALTASDMVAAGLCSTLASDYYYPAQIAAAFKIVRMQGSTLGAVWPLVSTNGARAMGLADRGEIAPGQRADLIVVDPRGPRPEVVATFVAGRLVHLARDLVAA